ncbi:conserved exported hypothetical protein [metagenome]|uniref:Uncharacterized protein n=1 Tax=metagenome TaxID=256318 RepID=A0A2P2BWX9_9ZZZZ
MTRRALAALVALGVVSLAGCGPDSEDADPPRARSTPSAHASEGDQHAAPAAHKLKPLRAGEKRLTMTMSAPYTPSAPTGVGTDDYRCFLLDPGLSRDAFITGTNVLPGNPEVVHHVILFRVPAGDVRRAEALDDETPGDGWTCFGNSGISAAGNELDSAPWLGAWAPGGRETVFRNGLGVPLEKGSRIVMQVHYNLLAGDSPDVSATQLRLAPASAGLARVETMLMPTPVELPCRPGHDASPLCDRATALADVKARFGDGPGSTADLLHFLCGPVRAGEVQTCDRTILEPTTIVGVAGHMHLLGRSIQIEVNPDTPRARTILDLEVWDFDNQGAKPIKPIVLQPSDTVRVTCRHVQWLRDRLPAFEGQPDRYVVWGEGTTDEMCLGILQVVRG